MAYKSEQLTEKWEPILNNEEFGGEIKENHRRDVTAILLENQVKALQEERQALNEAPVNVVGNYAPTGDGAMAKFDPVLISLVRRTTPQLMAFDIAGVQPMTMPTGLVFAMRPRYVAAGAPGDEAWYPGESNTNYSGEQNGSGVDVFPHDLSDPTVVHATPASNTYTTGRPMTTAKAELLGTDPSGDQFREMSFTIEKTEVSARSRALRATYTVELQQDFKSVHGGDADAELGSILSTQIVAETNRELIRTVYTTAKPGAATGTTAVAGTFDLDVDSNGRWSVERFKGLIYQIERDLNHIAQDTRFGKGNWIITSADVASAMAMIGVLDYTPALQANLSVDDTGNTFAGMLHGRVKVYIDPYSANFGAASQFYVAGYKGTNPYMAGLFYCPYVPLQMYRAVDPKSFQPAMGFKTRYGLVANPFAGPIYAGAGSSGLMNTNNNPFFRRTKVINLM